MSIVIVGAGEVGFNIAAKLSLEKKDVYVIEQSDERFHYVQDELDVQVIQGNGASPSILKEAGIEDAQMLIAVTDQDEVNITSCLFASHLNPQVMKVARVRNPEYITYHNEQGGGLLNIDFQINPEGVVADKLLKIISVPKSREVVEFDNGRVVLVGFKIDVNCRFAGKLILEVANEYPKGKFLVTAIVRKNEIIIPKGNHQLLPEDIIYVITPSDMVEETMNIFSKNREVETKRVMIFGGSNIGFSLAQQLEKKGLPSIKIIEKDESLCEYLAWNLSRVTVLNGKGTDESLLTEESIEDVDAFISVSRDDEANILAALLAKHLGAGMVCTVINKLSYFSLLNTIGIDVAISPHLLAANSILRFIRRGKVVALSTFFGEAAEAIEFIVPPDAPIVNIPIKHLKIPKGAILGTIVRDDEIIIPRGDDIVRAHDKVITFLVKDILPSVETLFASRE